MAASPVKQLSEGLLQMADLMATVLEATEGYRRACEAKGFSPTAAEQMAMAYHDMLVGHLLRQ